MFETFIEDAKKDVWNVVIMPFLLVSLLIGVLYLMISTIMKVFSKKDFTVPKKNELVFYHAGWCGYCKEFMPVFDATSPELKAQFPELIITKYQEENDRDAIQSANPPVEGFPTIRLNGAEFEGPRTSEGLMMFVQKNYA